jgi:hypothetical protein
VFAGPILRSVTGLEPVPPVPESHTSAHPVADSDAVTDGDPVPDSDAVPVPDCDPVPNSYPVAVTAWVIAETGALVAAPTAALTLSVAGARACLGAVTRVRGRQRQSPIARRRLRAGQSALFLAAPVAAPAAELVPPTVGTVPQARPGRLCAWRARTWGGLPNADFRGVGPGQR